MFLFTFIVTVSFSLSLKLSAVNLNLWDPSSATKLNESLAGMRARNRGRDSESYNAMTTADVDAYKFDVNQIRLGAGISESRIASQIAVNKNWMLYIYKYKCCVGCAFIECKKIKWWEEYIYLYGRDR